VAIGLDSLDDVESQSVAGMLRHPWLHVAEAPSHGDAMK
jgi:hypothetical protein